MTTLKITVGERDRLDERTRRRIEAAEDDADLDDDDQPVLNLGSYEELARLLSPKNLELLHCVAEAAPESIRETAQLVDRDYKQVHRNLHELADVGVLEFEGGGTGRPKRPTLTYDGLEIDVRFAELDGFGAGPEEANAD